MSLFTNNTFPVEASEQRLVCKIQNFEVPKSSPTEAAVSRPNEAPIVDQNSVTPVPTTHAELARLQAQQRLAEAKASIVAPSTAPSPQVAAAVQEQAETPAKETLLTKAMKIPGEIKEDFMKGGWGTKIGYIAGFGVGFLAIRLLWKKAESEGWKKKTSRFVLSILSGMGVMALFHYVKNLYPHVPETIVKAKDTVGDAIGDATTKLERNKNWAYGIITREQCETDEEYTQALELYLKDHDAALPSKTNLSKEEYMETLEQTYLEVLAKNGTSFGYVSGTVYLLGANGLSTILQSGSLAKAAMNIVLSENEERSEAGWEFAKIYMEGSVLYLCSFGAVDLAVKTFTVGPKAAFARTVVNAGLWPIELFRKGIHTVGLLDETGRTRIVVQTAMLKENIYSHSAYLSRVLKLSPFRRSLELRCLENFRAWEINRNIALQAKNLKLDNLLFEARKLEALKRLAKDLGSNRYIPEFIQNSPEAHLILDQIRTGGVDIKNLEHVLEAAPRTSGIGAAQSSAVANAVPQGRPTVFDPDAAAPGKQSVGTQSTNTTPRFVDDGGPVKVIPPETAPVAAATPDEGLKIFDPGDAAKSGGAAAEAAAEGAREVSATLKQSNQVDSLLRNHGFERMLFDAGVDPKVARELLLSMKELDADTLIRISRSPSAKQLLVGAMKVDDTLRVKELSRVMNAAKNSKIMMGMNLVGAGADILGCVMCMADYIGNEEKIVATQNEQLRAMYLMTKPIIIAEGATSFTGLVIGSVVVGTHLKAGASLATALAAGTSWVMLPIGVAAAFVRATHSRLVESVEYHALSEQELMPYSPGALLQDINSTSETSRLNYSQTFADYFHVPDGGNYDPESANRGARDERYRAYFSQIAVGVVPQVMLKFTDIQGKKPEQILQAREIAQKDEYRRFVANAMAYLRFKSSKTFETVSPEMLHDAQLFAQNAPPEQWGLTAAEAERTEVDFVTMKEETNESTKQYLLELCSDSERFQTEFPVVLFNDLRHQLAHMERKLLEAGYTGFNDAARNKARGYVAYHLWDILRDLGKKVGQGSPLPEAQLNITLSAIHELLATDPDRLALAADSSKNVHKHESEGSNPLLLTVDSLSAYANRYRLTKPETLGTSELTALPLESLRLYQADRLRGKMPYLMKLKPGTSEGYLLVSEDLWTRSTALGECTKIEGTRAAKAVQLKPGVHRFWNESSMPMEGTGPVMAYSMPVYSSSQTFRVLPTPTRPPDFEVIVEQAA